MVIHVKGDVLLGSLFETRGFGRDRVLAQGKLRQGVLAGIVGHRGLLGLCRHLQRSNGSSANDSAARVGYFAADIGRIHLPERGSRQKKDCEPRDDQSCHPHR